MHKLTPESPFVPRAEAARRLGLSPSTISRLVAEGKLAGGRVGLAKIGICRASLDRYVQTVLGHPSIDETRPAGRN